MSTRYTGYALAACALMLMAALVPVAEADGFYVVRSGDTLWAIAARFGMSVSRLAEANHLLPAAPIHPGLRLVTAAPTIPPPRPSLRARPTLPSRSFAYALNLVRAAIRFVGWPYQWSGIGEGGFDCSGLVSRVFAAVGLHLPHSSFSQYQAGTPVAIGSLAPGDLVFFWTYSRGPSHVGIYVGDGRFVHASFSKGVIISSMNEPYYRARYVGARRLPLRQTF
jgi:LysM repeat protein